MIADDHPERLEKLTRLREAGVLNDAEFERRKALLRQQDHISSDAVSETRAHTPALDTTIRRHRWLFRVLIIPVAGALGLCLATPAAAIDCTKAGNAVEKRICASGELKQADASLNRAYAALLRAAPDAEIRAMIVTSQRRWIKARDHDLESNLEGQPLSIAIVRDAIGSRAADLRDRSKTGLIAQALAQRRYLGQFPRGAFSGFASDCGFFPADRNQESFTYSCMGMVSVQNGDRLCAMSEDWATYAIYTHYGMSRIAAGRASPAAYCDPQSATGCGDGESGWQAVGAELPKNFPVLGNGVDKLDAENGLLLDDDNRAWFTSCLTKPGFPHLGQ
ncbi:lysozyme inhibitor LprI family protein [Dongia sp.]|uniref:lysozyme inhibitor LprI family protein n=1 Tax=Dongia sp. TaxID=1977262 RepID=UPI003750C377